MKNRSLSFQHLLLLLLLGMAACTSDEFIPSIIDDEPLNTYTVQMDLKFPEEVGELAVQGHTISFKNEIKGIAFQAISDTLGHAVFANVEPGLYTLTASIHIEHNNRKRILNGYLEMEVNADSAFVLSLRLAEIGRLVISQYYYSGYLSSGNSLNYHDQFVEIYNNSADTLYADGLSIVEHASNANTPSPWKHLEPTHMVVQNIWTIPGNGFDVPVLPGKSLVLATNGFNHHSDPNGDTNSPVDLGDADFEYFLYTETGTDTDYPGVPNLVEVYLANTPTWFTYAVHGGSAIALAWLPEDIESYVEKNLVPYEFVNNTRYYCTFPNALVEDAVETVKANFEPYKRMDASLDAGYVVVEAGSKSGLCIRRKVAEIIDGRKVLMDTNNSTEDFEHDVVPVPRFFE